MLPTYVLLDILKCMSREELEKMQETNRMIDDIIKRDFASKPLRLIDEDIVLYVSRSKNNEFLLGIWQRYNQCYVPTVPGWQDCMKYHESDSQPCQHHSYPIDEMRPFLAKYLRYRNVEILITENDSCLPSYSPEQIAVLESICHIWSGQKLSILDTDYGDTDHNIDTLKRIFGSSAILQCRPLLHWKGYCAGNNNVATSLLASGVYPSSNLYSVHSIYFFSLKLTDLLNLVHYKTEYPHSSTIFVLYGGQIGGEYECNAWCFENLGVFRKIKEEFLTSSVPCRLQVLFELEVYVWDTQESPEKDWEFRLENSCTKEVLQLKRITMTEAKEKFDLFFDEGYDGDHDVYLMVFCLERFPA